ncbi:MAG: hypothetical protein K9I94_14345 [Bacteroidales bacterium]|nr:hypothetical protein [Bacteroidales bacterium]
MIAWQFHLETTVQSAKDTIAASQDELVEAPYVQKEKEMLQDPERFSRIRNFMYMLLDYLEQLPV